jgi:hypothetical protein
LTGRGLSKYKRSDDSKESFTVSEETSDADSEESTAKYDMKESGAVITEAKALASEGKYADAIKLLNSIRKTDDVSALITEYAEPYLNSENFGCYWQEDETSDYHWAYAKGQDRDVHDFSFLIYIHQSKTNKNEYGFHLFSSFTGFSDETEWVFPNSIRIKGDKNEAIDITVTDRNNNVSGSAMHEWVNIDLTQEQFDAICKVADESSTVTVRLRGYTNQRDFTLTSSQIEDLRITGKYGRAFSEVYGESKLQE